MLISLCAKLDQVKMGEPSLVKEFEQDCIENQLAKRKELIVIK